MKNKQQTSSQQQVAVQTVSIAWAILLLTPLIIVAGNAGNRLLFHFLLFIAGWHCWAFTEYFFHRFIMHEASQEKGLGKLLNHTHHHTAPDDIRVKHHHRMIMIVSCVLFAAFSFMMNNYFTIVFGYVMGFSAYSFMHFILHQSWSAKLFPRLHKAHIHHHCKHPDKCFGVISTWWDFLFNTIPIADTSITERIKQFYFRHEKK